MAVERSIDEAKQEYIGAMGDVLGSLYHALWHEVAWLHRKWHEYVELFGTKESRIHLCNAAAPAFFRIVEDALWDDALIHVTRLTDPPKIGRKHNLSILRLASLIDDAAASARVKALTHSAVHASAFCRDWRNRRIAHLDLDLALNAGAEPLEPASREKIWLAIAAINNVLDAVSLHYLNGTSIFDWGGHPGGALSLLYVIDDGVRADTERRTRLERGELYAGDWQARDL
jgi:AbiU2